MQKYLYQDLYKLEEEHFWHIAKRKAVSWLIKQNLSKRKNIKILDVGCGTGKNIESFKGLGQVWGLDNSKQALNFCRKRGLKNLVLGSATNTKFKSEFFDIITMLDVLEHTDDNKVLREINRILKPGGLVIITVPAYQWMWSQWDNVLHHKRRYSKQTLKKTLIKNNFVPTKISYMHSYLIIPALLVRTIKKIVRHNDYGSDFTLSNNTLNQIMHKVAQAEFNFIKTGLVPFGLSIIAAAKKNDYD